MRICCGWTTSSQELGQQLEHLESQAERAGKYRGFEASLKRTQQLLWLLRKRDAAAQRAKIARDVEALGTELEAETARLRTPRSGSRNCAPAITGASDAVHAAQGALYEVNAEVRPPRAADPVPARQPQPRRAPARFRAQSGREQRDRQSSWQRRVATMTEHFGRKPQNNLPCSGETLRLRPAQRPVADENLPRGTGACSPRHRSPNAGGAAIAPGRYPQRGPYRKAAAAARVPPHPAGGRARRPGKCRTSVNWSGWNRDRRARPSARRPARCVGAMRRGIARSSKSLSKRRRRPRNRLSNGCISSLMPLTALQSLQEQVSRSGELEPWLDRNRLRQSLVCGKAYASAKVGRTPSKPFCANVRTVSGLRIWGQAHGWLSEPPPGKVSPFHPCHRGRAGRRVRARQGWKGYHRTQAFLRTDAHLSAVLSRTALESYVLADPALALSRGKIARQGHVGERTGPRVHRD